MSSIFSYQSIGAISGSSLDGLDVALVRFTIDPAAENPIVDWHLVKGSTYPFPESLVDRLRHLPYSSALELVKTDDELGLLFAESINEFIDGEDHIDFISSHGHTIFHHPRKSSTQIGNPAIIAAKTGIKTIGHLRNMDTAYGGQGAPLAPIADLYLLPGYDICINLGGIANISIKSEGGIIGFDVCGANQFLNHLAQKVGKPYDDDGYLARSGVINIELLTTLNAIPYCTDPPPKSLDNEEVRSYYLPILKQNTSSTINQLATMVEHIAMQIAKYVDPEHQSVHIAGGGGHNGFLVERIRHHISPVEVHVPKDAFLDFKEAALIAICGGLRLHELPNSLKSITGARQNTVNGVVFIP